MKVLIFTQKIDKNDDVLGFFSKWVEKFAEHNEKVTVICLYKGEYNFPKNVKVLSLGKEKKSGKINFIINFYKYIWQERKNYESVFVHMNQEYVLMGGLIWRFLNKKIALWYNHTYGNFWTDISMTLVHMVFYTSPYSYTSKSKKSKRMPAGIDTSYFKRDKNINKQVGSVMYIGRLAPIKKIDILIDAVKLLIKNGENINLSVYGEAEASDEEYFKDLKKIGLEIEESGELKFCGSVSNWKTPKIYNKNLICVNLTPKGNYDKTVLESMSCGTIPIVSSIAFSDIIPKTLIFKENNIIDLANKIKFGLNMQDVELKEKFRKYVVNRHDLDLLVRNIKTNLSN